MAAILHIDTSGPACIIMLAKGGKPVAARRGEGEREHAANINRLIDEVLIADGILLKDIAAVAVCNGPGSYTGLRIGLATAKGLCYALDKPLILHNRLSLMLREAAHTRPEAASLAAILTAREGEYYAAIQGPEDSFTPRHITITELLPVLLRAACPLHITGRTAPDLLPVIAQQHVFFSAHTELDNYMWAAAATEDFAARCFTDIAYAVPEYLKAAFTTTRRADG